jgi:hypothetical protein
MRFVKRAGLVPVGGLIVVVLAVGCGGPTNNPEPPRQQAALTELATILPVFPRPPKGVADLVGYREASPVAYEAVRSGEVVVVWGVKMPGEGEAGKGTTDVVAYEKAAPTAGGFVLLHNGTVKKMTADEFKAAKMAK